MRPRITRPSTRAITLGAFVCASLLTGALGLPAASADDERHRPGPGGTDGSREHRERLMEQALDQMRALRVWKITEELKLDEATAAKLFPLLATYDEQVLPLGRERHHTHRELREALEAAHPDAARVTSLVDALLANRARMMALEDERMRATRKVLTPVQHAKLLLLMPRLEDDFRRRIRDARGKGGPHGHPGRGGPPPPGSEPARP